MTRNNTDVAATVESHIITIRGQKVILDRDLARLYGVETKALKQAVTRNPDRFPADFSFVLTRQEVANLRSQFVTSSSWGGSRYLPVAFTEHGAIMAANVLRSSEAVQMSVFVVRAFIRMRGALSDTTELARKLASLEREIKGRLDTHDAAIVDVFSRIMDLIDPPELPPVPPKKQIGFVDNAGPSD
jgi:hypothetical protein